MHLTNLFSKDYVITNCQSNKMIIREAQPLFPQKKKKTGLLYWPVW